jgi:hypothetical protein
MSKKILFGACALTMAMMLDASAASADHIDGSYAAPLNSIEAAIEAGTFAGSGNDETNLLVKLDAADAKIDLGKFSDAADKLQDISDKATALATAKKPKLGDANAINAAVSEAIICVGALL